MTIAAPVTGDGPSAAAHEAAPVPAPARGFETVMLATDLSAVSQLATTRAIELAGALGARLVVINVVETSSLTGGVGRTARVDQLRQRRQDALLAIVGDARRAGVRSDFLAWDGDVAPSIVAASESERADLVVVGSRGLDRAGRFLLGSVSDHVVHHAPCPVLVVRPERRAAPRPQPVG